MSLLRKLINYPLPVWDFAYILQLEEYELRRYLKQVQLRLFKRNFERRDVLRYTARMKLTLVLLVFSLLALFFVAYWINIGLLVALLITLPLSTPYLLGVISFIVQIPTSVLEKQKCQKAARVFALKYPTTKVIGITGSFGKTTAKYLLQHVLQYDFNVAIIPDNINTALGIADFVLKNKLPQRPDYLIVEMGAYKRGDIEQTATMLPPDYAILTILGDQHMERFGSKSNLITGKSEIFTTNKQTVCYTSTDSVSLIHEQQININQLIPVDIPTGEKSTPHLVRKLAHDLGISDRSIEVSLNTFNPPERRNNIIERQGVTIIDNSYNISPMVAKAMVQDAATIAAKQGKKLVVMTGGIGEQGTDEVKVNLELANALNQYADRVLINPTVFAKHMVSTLVIPTQEIVMSTDVTDSPALYLDGTKEILLWLTGHSDLAYL